MGSFLAVTPHFGKRPWARLVAATMLLLPIAAGCGEKEGGGASVKDRFAGQAEAEKKLAKRDAALAQEEAEKKAAAKSADDEATEAARKPPPPPNQAPAAKPKEGPAAAEPVKSGSEIALAAVPPAIADWKEKDYFAARLAHDPRLLPALQRLAKNSVGDDSAVRIFAALLVPQATAAVPQAAPGHGADATNRSAPLLEAAVAGLAMNQTPGARQVLIPLLSGLYPTDDDAAGTFAVLKALAEHPSEENDDLLLRVLTSAEQLRPAGRGTVTAEALQAKAIALLGPAGSGLRMKIARLLVQPETPPALRNPLVSLLREKSPLNFEAQVCLDQNGVLPGEASGPVEKGLAGYSSDAFALLTGLSGVAAAEQDGKWTSKVAGQLWSQEFVASLTARLPRVESLREAAPLMLLASTLPNDTVRSALYRTLTKHWEDGPAALGAAGVEAHAWCEPGFPVLVKLVYRRSFPDRNTNEVQFIRVRQLAGERALALSRYTAWMQAGRVIANRFATLPSRPGPAVHGTASSSELPVKIDAPQDVIAEYHLDWPSAMRDTLLGLRLDPLSVHYVRIEEKAQPSKVVAHYRRELKLGERVKVPERGKTASQSSLGAEVSERSKGTEVHESAARVWFDHLSVGSTPDRARSLDIVIRPANPDAPMMRDQERKMIVEILAIEINDPTRGREVGQN